jgi:alpha-beta hydrolase superfamily lysophospholipase
MEATPPLARRAALLLSLASLLAACSAAYPAQHLSAAALAKEPPTRSFTLPDGARLPYRTWFPATPPSKILLAFHGFNDSADAWELPAPAFTAAGIAVIAPDQRGFGAAPGRGRWPGTAQLTADAAALATQIHAEYPTTPLYLMGESMGAAMLMQLATQPNAPPVAGYVLISPAVWGWNQLALPLRAALFLTNAVAPGAILSAGPIRVHASDNRAALIRLSTDPKTLIKTRVAALAGLVTLMSHAQTAARAINIPALVLYGGHDELVPKSAARPALSHMAAKSPLIRVAYYPSGYHLLLRDHDRARRIADIIAWLNAPAAPLPSGADRAALSFLSPATGP